MAQTPAPDAPCRPVALFGLAMAVACPLAAAFAAQALPMPDGPVAAIFPPWWDSASSIAASGNAGPVIRLGAADFVVVVAATDRQRLWQDGAWLLLDPMVAGGCSPASQSD
jgi:hypothetical protein